LVTALVGAAYAAAGLAGSAALAGAAVVLPS